MMSFWVNVAAVIITAFQIGVIHGFFKHFCRAAELEHWNECCGFDAKIVVQTIAISVLYFAILHVASYFGVVSFYEQIARGLLALIGVFVCDSVLRLPSLGTMSHDAAILSGGITLSLIVICVVAVLIGLIELRLFDFLISFIIFCLTMIQNEFVFACLYEVLIKPIINVIKNKKGV